MADEQEITSDVGAVSEPEMERTESLEEEPEKELDECAVAEGNRGETVCPIRMSYGRRRCGRKLHAAPDGVDEVPVCLMHSKDPRKQSGLLFVTFWQEFERILKNAGKNVAHFEHFVFPEFDLCEIKFQATCHFNDATFTQNADFGFAQFKKTVDFQRATFARKANFYNTTFIEKADFSYATFAEDALFYQAHFGQEGHFYSAIFEKDADFKDAEFELDAKFTNATFKKQAKFKSTKFMQDTFFSDTTFERNAYFQGAHFKQDANFNEVIFSQDADFNHAVFEMQTFFTESTTFSQTALFADTEFNGTVHWQGALFFNRAEFRRTRFEPHDKDMPSAVFALARFSKPGEVVFDDIDLSRALFHNCDVSQVWFTSSVKWAMREGSRGLAVFDERFPIRFVLGRWVRRERSDYRAVEQIYHQLKKNYDSRLDYWTANEFHFGEMEMKRLALPTKGPLLRLRQWWHPRLSLVALYKYASDYGNSYWKPVLWLLGFLVLFAALFPLPDVGLKRQGARQAETYASVWDLQKSYGENLWKELRLAGKGLITSVDAATFQRSAEYAPSYPWGRVLAILETLLTSSLFALFLLAIRRQFRR
jgi:hypothetical protein